ncbi:hypothetical protein BKA56DRAFT_602553 [Ilyonectria sp. MPI-CAGE-AT-0026]|nr:hypothetical protein BKA56DRAFT_602553 [Ilyonectria sp. MPI-CAGE-AT-0026]
MGSPAPHHRHQSSLEGVIDFSPSIEHPLSPDQRDKADGVFTGIINHFEGSSTADKPYNRAKLVRMTYEYARSEDSRCNFLQAFFGSVNITMDDSIDFNDETVEEEIHSSLNSFADFLVDNFFLPRSSSLPLS